MNNLDKQYTDLLQDILDNGVTKQDRTGTGTLSVFGRQIRHKMSDGFPLLTTKKMPFKTITTELLWFLRGDTNIKFLVDNNCNIWNGDAWKNYQNKASKEDFLKDGVLRYDDFINKIKTDDEFAKKWGELGPVYGKQWRSWNTLKWETTDKIDPSHPDRPMLKWNLEGIDQIANLINDIKINPDSRRLMVTAWNVGELDQMTLPPCHYGFQVYTRELSGEERNEIRDMQYFRNNLHKSLKGSDTKIDWENIPTRAISLMWNQRSVDTFLGLPFNIASYGLLLEIIAKAVNMIPDELIGNLGDVHLYSNHIEQAKEQIGRELDLDERREMVTQEMFNQIYTAGDSSTLSQSEINQWDVPARTREPYPLPTLTINTEFWPYEGGECGEGPLDAIAIFNGFSNEHFCRCLLEEDIQLGNYQSHPTIVAPLSN
ncbi:ThyA Thymidylate synthase [uncultured Caudovirales phage]|uniref:thymidylate synthase n=1 Tax=uncultured Caudovirales phage TaxID=2100421 RepID=A0A6J5PMS2_9CAUD|nr:ThyA Thymidylate synthase [uncultured Caudovirales phage]CAB4170671.1 ThyA Thymidylate synthase [uncultured Caudovirales phage]CAB4198501.1 ThyA Thymidylate synthase [uncultured Caudovirales phage]